MELHASLTWERLMEAAKRRNTTLDNPGFCVKCGAEHGECEGDAREYPCDACGEPHSVYGAEELLMEML